MARSYKLLSELPGVPVEICSALLPNKMRCWKPAAVLVTDTVPLTPAEAAEYAKASGIEKEKAETATGGEKKVTFQMCKHHALELTAADDAPQAQDSTLSVIVENVPGEPQPKKPAGEEGTKVATVSKAPEAGAAVKGADASKLVSDIKKQEAVATSQLPPQGENIQGNK